ncbi:MAG TPA: hypothetical protein VJU81_06755 [Methylomirabilota bacterium]|nr:hypothetical protein [Methylomirabilota bacterium]
MAEFSKTAQYEGLTESRSVTASRKHGLEHPALFATEIRVHPQGSAIVGTRRAPRP